MKLFSLNPVTAKRLRRFRTFKRAWISFWALVLLYVLSLCSELICNSRPLLLWHEGRPYFPVFFHYSADEFLGNGVALAADYRALEGDEAFVSKGGWMIWPLFRYDPNERVPSEELEKYRRVSVYLAPVPGVGTAVLSDGTGLLRDFTGGETLVPKPEGGFSGRTLGEYWNLPEGFLDAVRRRFANEASDEFEVVCPGRGDIPAVRLKLLRFKQRRRAPTRVQVRVLEETGAGSSSGMRLLFERGESEPSKGRNAFASLPEDIRKRITTSVEKQFSTMNQSSVESDRTYGERGEASSGGGAELTLRGRTYSMLCELERVEHPFRPVSGHWFGLDDAGRDVLARILYGLRTSLSFGLVLVVSSMMFGTVIGCVQGYLGGKVDMLGQRMIEIWSALPFLYIVILMGSLFGTGFWLLIGCYALFNWIGVSYYMRAEMLRLRRLPFVEAARCLGLPWWIVVVRHILPNALVPLVTFVPFSLVGAIGALAGLDYLGFGLPPPTPSLGQLLQQAQVQREAWWLIVYPSLALFIVMLLCVFIGEGVREAFDPKRQSRLQ